LLLKRFLQVRRPCLNLVEQPYILDRDDSLIGEGGYEIDLALRKRPYNLPRQRKDADRFTLAPERNAKISSVTAESLVLAGEIALRFIGEHVNDLDRNA
jgi:hypothetical protein